MTTESIGNSPDIDPANNDSMLGAVRMLYKKLQMDIDGMLPAKVIKYDRANNRVQVQILIMMLTTDGQKVSRSQVASVPVLVLGGGGLMINFPLNPGDLGWIMANDRDISLFLQSYEEAPPNTVRQFSFSDALFVPDVMHDYVIDPLTDSSALVIGTTDGTIKISVSPAGVVITSPTVTFAGEVLANGGLSVSGVGATPVNLTGNFLLTGLLAVVGNITASGTITPATAPPVPPF